MFFSAGYRSIRVLFKYFGESYWTFRCLDPRLIGAGNRFGPFFRVWERLGDSGVVIVDDVSCADVVVYLVGYGCSLGEQDIIAGLPGVVCVGRDRLLWMDVDGFCFWDVAELMCRMDNLFLLSWGKYRLAVDYCLPEVERSPRVVAERLGYNLPHHRLGAGALGGVFGVDRVMSIWSRLLVGPNIFCNGIPILVELGRLGGIRRIDCCFAGSGAGWGFGHRELLFERLRGDGDGLRCLVMDCTSGTMIRDDVGWAGDYSDLCCSSKVVLSPWGWSETSTREFVGNLNGCVVVKPGTVGFIEQWFESEHVACSSDYSDLVDVVAGAVDGYDQEFWEWRAGIWRDRLRNRDIEIAVRLQGILSMVAN